MSELKQLKVDGPKLTEVSLHGKLSQLILKTKQTPEAGLSHASVSNETWKSRHAFTNLDDNHPSRAQTLKRSPRGSNQRPACKMPPADTFSSN